LVDKRSKSKSEVSRRSNSRAPMPSANLGSIVNRHHQSRKSAASLIGVDRIPLINKNTERLVKSRQKKIELEN